MASPKLIIDLHAVPFTDPFAVFLDTMARSFCGQIEFLLLTSEESESQDHTPESRFKILRTDIEATKIIMETGNDKVCVGVITTRGKHFSPLSGPQIFVRPVESPKEINEFVIRETCDNLLRMQAKFPAKPSSTVLVMDQFLKGCRENAIRVPKDIVGMGKEIERIAVDLKVGTEDAFRAFVRLIKDGYFEAPILLRVLDAGLVVSLEDIRGLCELKVSEKLGPVTAKELEEDKYGGGGIEAEEEGKSSGFSTDEEDIIVVMLQEMVYKFVGNLRTKGWQTINKLLSLRKHFGNQLGTFPMAHLNSLVLNKIKSDPKLIDFITDKIIQVLKEKQYVIVNGGQVAYALEKFQASPDINMTSAEFRTYLHVAPFFGGEEHLDGLAQLKRDVCDVAKYVRDHFVTNCVAAGWFSIRKLASLREHFTNQIKQISNKVIVSPNLETIKIRADMHEKIASMVLKSLSDNGFIVFNALNVNYITDKFRQDVKLLPDIVFDLPQAKNPAKGPIGASLVANNAKRGTVIYQKASVQFGGFAEKPQDPSQHEPNAEKHDLKEAAKIAKDATIAKLKALGEYVPTTTKGLYAIITQIIQEKAINKDEAGKLAQTVLKELFDSEVANCTNPKLNGAEFLKPDSSAPVKFKL